jgi:hypothetical protein
MTDKKLKLEIAPGAFDNFDGTQEELDAMLAQIKQMMEDGTLFENSRELSDEEAAAIGERLKNIESRQ